LTFNVVETQNIASLHRRHLYKKPSVGQVEAGFHRPYPFFQDVRNTGGGLWATQITIKIFPSCPSWFTYFDGRLWPYHEVDFLKVFLYNACNEKNETIRYKLASYIKTTFKRGGLK
jgi:hypothetical protein